tara:strand:+ start:8647 stop:9366 length:720 start_codon:yes stop_codon:yes gene_type:complete
MLEASISVSMMKNILKGLQSITEDCILDFSKDGLTVHVVDSIRAKMLRLKVIPSAFESYTCNEKHRLAVELSKLKAITTSLTTKDELKISYKDNKFALLANNMERAIRLKKIDLVYDLRAIPDFDYEWNTTVSSAKEIKDYIKTLDKIPILQIEVEEQKMVWQTLDAEELISWNPNLEMECEEEFTATQLYTAAEINACIAASTKEEVALCGGSGSCPIQFTWTPYEGVEYTGLVAPRM